jgi:hypothetical protein
VSRRPRRGTPSLLTGIAGILEAGRDGFYPYRRLTEAGHEVWVADEQTPCVVSLLGIIEKLRKTIRQRGE